VHFADSVESYRALPRKPREFLSNLPVAWDDTRLLEGYPGRFAVIARRSGDEWFLGAINGHCQTLEIKLKADFLADGKYHALWIGDGSDARSFDHRESQLTAGDVIPLSLRPFGGGTMHLKPATSDRGQAP
jgi:hypothetical protein